MDTKRRKISGQEGSSSSRSGVGGGAYNVPIRTLHIAAIKPDMDDQIKLYFEQFGTVNSVEIRQGKNTHYGLVEFKSVEAAAAVLSSNGIHLIGGYNFQVKAADPWLQPDHILNVLNDDCLRSILLHLNLSDLTSAAKVCVRFNEQAKSVFSTKFKKKLALTDGSYEAAENLLQTFGSLAQTVNFKFNDTGLKFSNNFKFLTMINRWCTSTLKELTFYEVSVGNFLPSDVQSGSALSTIEKLSIDCCQLHNSFNTFLSGCTELKVLHISRCDLKNVDMWKFDKALPKLEELRLIYVPMEDLDDLISRIIRSGSKLEKFSLFGYLNKTNAWNTTRVIVQHCPNLVELQLTLNGCTGAQYAESVHRLQQLTSLKVLKLDFSRKKSMTPLRNLLTSNAAPIEHLKLWHGRVDTGTIKAISQMKHLKVLELSAIKRFTDEHMIELAKGLGSKLEKLQLEGSTAMNLTTIGLKKALPFATKLSLLKLESWSMSITIDTDDYKSMLCTVKKRPEMVKLLIELIGEGGKVTVDEQVQEKNRGWLYIDKKN